MKAWHPMRAGFDDGGPMGSVVIRVVMIPDDVLRNGVPTLMSCRLSDVVICGECYVCQALATLAAGTSKAMADMCDSWIAMRKRFRLTRST